MTQRVMAIYPHPDDETLGKGGALAQHVKEGATVSLVCATSGQMGRRMGKPFFANRETLWEIREKELFEACRELGFDDVRLWRLLDKTLQFEDPEELADRVEKELQDIKPDIVYTYYPKYAVHPDHDALAEAVIIAIARMPENERPVVYASAFSRGCEDIVGPPDRVIDVSDVLDEKLAATRAHKSQTEFFMQKLEQKLKDHPEEREELLKRHSIERYWTYKF